MDPEEDVLALFLSSHGSEDGLAVENGSLPLAQLAPEDVREALNASGIRWRVIVVSACHSGVFIDALKSDTTAIITASDVAHDSFGCEDDRELTWFGEAFLKDSLPGSASLEDAFHKAAGLIAQREDAEHQTHSNPQLYLGQLMAKKLAELPPVKPTRDSRAYAVGGGVESSPMRRQASRAAAGRSRRSRASRYRSPARTPSGAERGAAASPLAIVILAAGEGKRMRSALPKVLQP